MRLPRNLGRCPLYHVALCQHGRDQVWQRPVKVVPGGHDQVVFHLDVAMGPLRTGR